jgi:hypothetical protein
MLRAIGIVVALLACLPLHAVTSPSVVNVSANNCVPGLYQQPNGGPFAVFVFCDDAAGVNIGVVNPSGAAGPGRIDLGPLKVWDKWQVNDRFWQQPAWATDITSFAWSPDLKSLYVGTSEVYGTGALYKLDLVNRTYQKLIPTPEWRLDPKYGHSTSITAIDSRSGEVYAELATYDEASKRIEVRKVKVR